MTKRGRGRPRREGADERILAIAIELLREKGYRDVTIDAIAERAGVAKTTIYRRWPSKGALIATAITPLVPVETDDPEVMLRDIASILALIGVADDDSGMGEVVRAAIAPRREALRALLARRADADADLRADALAGALLVRTFVTGAVVTDDLPAELLRVVRGW